MTTAEQVKTIRAKSGLTQSAFADRFEIPLRTLEDWERGTRQPPIYVLQMLEILVDHHWDAE